MTDDPEEARLVWPHGGRPHAEDVERHVCPHGDGILGLRVDEHGRRPSGAFELALDGAPERRVAPTLGLLPVPRPDVDRHVRTICPVEEALAELGGPMRVRVPPEHLLPVPSRELAAAVRVREELAHLGLERGGVVPHGEVGVEQLADALGVVAHHDPAGGQRIEDACVHGAVRPGRRGRVVDHDRRGGVRVRHPLVRQHAAGDAGHAGDVLPAPPEEPRADTIRCEGRQGPGDSPLLAPVAPDEDDVGRQRRILGGGAEACLVRRERHEVRHLGAALADEPLDGAADAEHEVVVVEPRVGQPAVCPVPDPCDLDDVPRHSTDVEEVEQGDHDVDGGVEVVPMVLVALDVGHPPAQCPERVAELAGRVRVPVGDAVVVPGHGDCDVDRRSGPIAGPAHAVAEHLPE